MYLDKFTFSELFVGRHGQSLANLANMHAHNGNEQLIEQLRHRHTSEMPLTDEGIAQSKRKGSRLRLSMREPLVFYVSSAYLRARQTALHMQMPGSSWRADACFNERDWGPMDQISSRERTARWPRWKEEKEADPYHWRPVEGESIADKCAAVSPALLALAEECSDRSGVIVAHGETNLAIQAIVERITPERFNECEKSLRMDNATFLHYRRDAHGTVYKRLVDPHTHQSTPWKVIR